MLNYLQVLLETLLQTLVFIVGYIVFPNRLGIGIEVGKENDWPETHAPCKNTVCWKKV